MLIQLVLAGVELAPALLDVRLGLGEGAVALGDPAGVESVRVEEIAVELSQLTLPVGEPTLLDAQPVALLPEALFPGGQLGLGLGELLDPLAGRVGRVDHGLRPL